MKKHWFRFRHRKSGRFVSAAWAHGNGAHVRREKVKHKR